MDDLVTWLRTALDDDERVARAVADHRGRPGELTWSQHDPQRTPGLIGDALGNIVTYDEGNPNEQQSAHIARHDPARVLRDVAAKRAIVDTYDDLSGPFALFKDFKGGMASALLGALEHLAAVYADRPGYRPEWAPDG